MERVTDVRFNLRKLRKNYGLSQKQFSELFDSNRAAYSAYEEGRCNPPLPFLKQVIDFYEIEEVYEFIFGERKNEDI